MGFGSYDESEQRDDTVTADESDQNVRVHEHEHNGELSFESNASADDLLSQLDSIKDAKAEDESKE